jgi:hypothetical protein
MRARVLVVVVIVVMAAPVVHARDYELVVLDASNTLLRFHSADVADVTATKVHDVAGT